MWAARRGAAARHSLPLFPPGLAAPGLPASRPCGGQRRAHGTLARGVAAFRTPRLFRPSAEKTFKLSSRTATASKRPHPLLYRGFPNAPRRRHARACRWDIGDTLPVAEGTESIPAASQTKTPRGGPVGNPGDGLATPARWLSRPDAPTASSGSERRRGRSIPIPVTARRSSHGGAAGPPERRHAAGYRSEPLAAAGEGAGGEAGGFTVATTKAAGWRYFCATARTSASVTASKRASSVSKLA